jgi:phage gpG-like protein
MITITVKNIEAVSNYLKKSTAEVLDAMKQGLVDGMSLFQAKFTKDQLSGPPGLNVLTGALRRSFTVDQLRVDLVRMSTNSPYFWIHQMGGVINMKAKLLTIPACEDAIRHTASDFDLAFSWPIFVSTGKKALVERSSGKVYFWLRESVTIPKSLYLFESFEQGGEQIIRDAIKKRLMKLRG